MTHIDRRLRREAQENTSNCCLSPASRWSAPVFVLCAAITPAVSATIQLSTLEAGTVAKAPGLVIVQERNGAPNARKDLSPPDKDEEHVLELRDIRTIDKNVQQFGDPLLGSPKAEGAPKLQTRPAVPKGEIK